MDDVGKENLNFNAAISDPGEIRPDTQGASGLAEAGGQREKLPSGRAVRLGLAGLAMAGGVGIAGCKIAKEKLATSTPPIVRVIDAATPTERPRLVESVFAGKEPMYITGGLIGGGMGGPGGISEAIEAHEGDIEWIKSRVDAEARKSAEVAAVSPRLWTPFLNPKEEMVIGFGEEGALGIVMPKDGDGKATQAYKVEKVGDITPLTTGKMEYFCFPGSSFEPVTENGDKPIEGLMRLREREAKKVLDIYEINPRLDALEVVLEVRVAQRLPNGEFAKDALGKYIFEGEKAKAIVILTSSADGMIQSVTVMKGELYPVEGKLREGVIAQLDYSTMLCTFSQKNAQGVIERMGLTYDPFTGKWEGGNREEVITTAPEIEGILDLEGFKRVWDEEKGRYDYVDVDGKVIAHWDEKVNEGKGRVELEKGITSLDLEKHRGLIIDWSAEDAYQEYLAAGKIPITIITPDGKGMIGEGWGLKPGVGFVGINDGSSVYALFDGEVKPFVTATADGKPVSRGFYFSNKKLNLTIAYFCNYQGSLPSRVTRGSRIATLDSSLVGGFHDSLFARSQAVTFLGNKDCSETYEFNFARLMRDSLGRLVRIGPAVGK